MKRYLKDGERLPPLLLGLVGLGVLGMYFKKIVPIAIGVVLTWGPLLLFGWFRGQIASRFPRCAGWHWLGFPASFALGWLLASGFHKNFTVAQPGALFEKARYEARIYVRVFPGNRAEKSYLLPAWIRADLEESEDETGFSTDRVYSIERLELPGGRRVVFSDLGNPLRLNRRIGVMDDEHRRWEIELTPEFAP